MRRLFLFLAGLLVAAPAWADAAPPTPEKLAALHAHSVLVLARSKDVEGVFEVQEDGQIKHLQSGLVCPAEYPNAELVGFFVYPSAAAKGLDVGCDYRRADNLGGASAKFTIFATKAGPGTTLDGAFDGYRREITQAERNIRAQGPALRESGNRSSLPEIRSEEYLVTLNNRDYTSQLIVSIIAGWVVEVRATFEGRPNEIRLDQGATVQDGVNQGLDRTIAFRALMQAANTVGK